MNSQQKLRHIASCRLPTQWGLFTMHGFEEPSGQEHVAIVMGEIEGKRDVLARIHSECLTGDALFSRRCDCGPQLEAAMKRVQEEGFGVILYLRQEGRGIGLINKIRAYKLQDGGLDTVEANLALGLPADGRDFGIAREMLDFLNVKSIRLMTNNPKKVESLEQLGFDISERVAIFAGHNEDNRHYLDVKAKKMGHLL